MTRPSWLLVALLAGCGAAPSNPYTVPPPHPPEHAQPEPARLRLVFRVYQDPAAEEAALRAILARALEESGGGSAVRRPTPPGFVDASFEVDGPFANLVLLKTYKATFDAPGLDLSSPGELRWRHDPYTRGYHWKGGEADPRAIAPVEGTPGRFRAELGARPSGPMLSTRALVRRAGGLGLAWPGFALISGGTEVPITIIDESLEVDLSSVLVFDIGGFRGDASALLDRIERAALEHSAMRAVHLVETTHWFEALPVIPLRAP